MELQMTTNHLRVVDKIKMFLVLKHMFCAKKMYVSPLILY